jgi:hypothetical protein
VAVSEPEGLFTPNEEIEAHAIELATTETRSYSSTKQRNLLAALRT